MIVGVGELVRQNVILRGWRTGQTKRDCKGLENWSDQNVIVRGWRTGQTKRDCKRLENWSDKT